MSKRMGRHTIEHWRDGELIERFQLTATMIDRGNDGTARIVLPPGFVELATGDELRFDCEGLAELLRGK